MRCCIETKIKWLHHAAGNIFQHAATISMSVLFATACGKSSLPTALDLPFFFTCDTHGRLEPCGCFSGQFGGLTRLKSVLDSEASAAALRVDVGDAIGGHEDYDLIEYKYLLRAYAAMKYDALNIGWHEAQFTANQLKSIKQTSPVPILSANLLEKTGAPPI